MKLGYAIGFLILILGALNAQRNISVLLLDQNNMALKAQDVAKIEVSLCGQDGKTIIYSETFLFPTLVDGLANLEIGSGTKQAAYIEAVNNHFKNLVPTSDATIIVKIDASLLNGKLLKFNDEIKLNDPVPIIKVFDNKYVGVSPFGINIADANRNAHINAREMFFRDSSVLLNTVVAHTGMDIYSGQNRFANFSSDGINMIKDEEYAKFFLGSGLDLQNVENKSNYGLTGGQVKNLLNGKYYKFSAEEFSLGQESNSLWYFNQNGGGFNPNANVSHLFNNNSYSIKDNSSKREARFFYNGFTGYYDNQPRLNLGVTTSGSPLFNFLSSAGKFLYYMSPNSDAANDNASYSSDGTVIHRQTTVNNTGGRKPYGYITDDGVTPRAGWFISAQNVATIFATVKNFRMDHPLLADQDIVYASLEGPEAAAYCRGKGLLTQGKQFVLFPDHFKFVCSPEDLTIQLTPRSAKSRGLAVTEIKKDGFRVEELMDGTGTYEFFWEVKGIRKGFEDYKVVRSKSEIMPIPFKRVETKE